MKKIFKWLIRLILLFFATSIFSVIVYSFAPVFITPLMIIRSTEQVFDGKFPVMHKRWVPIEEISPYMIQAVVAGEDQNFLNHWGFDFKAMKKAYEYNKKGKKIRGGSTISQQTAKNVFLWPSRSYVRKVFEAYFTMLIEIFWSKERIMEVYLNVIETGDGYYGVEMAARKYFKKPAKKLTRSEAAAIAACLPNPRKYNPLKNSKFVTNRKNFILRYMNYMPKTLN
ncbi:MAG: monofunctional biosynthetic peptidoglycan transglycosylase [Bacteroidales bacterium]|nr:monofunctional biosynthetic peptidoglycan transglycosylase [Bacteroidales bacterium]